METIFCFVDKEKTFLLLVILLQIVMLSPRTHLVNKSWATVQNHWVPVQNTKSPELKMLGPFCDQTDKKIFFCKAQPRLKKYASLNNSHKNSHRNHTNRIFYENIIDLCIPRDACQELLCVFGDDFYASGMQDAEVTKSLCSTFSQLLTVSFRQQQPHL